MTTWLHEQRVEAVHAVMRASGAQSVLDLGCGEGDLLVRLLAEPQIERIVGIDICPNALERLRKRLATLEFEPLVEVELIHGSMTDATPAMANYDCAVLLEVIEHVDPERLSVVERAVFGIMRPAAVVITTPNADFNPLLGVPQRRFRNLDHRFEWGRAKFRRWAQGVADRAKWPTSSDLLHSKAQNMFRYQAIDSTKENAVNETDLLRLYFDNEISQ